MHCTYCGSKRHTKTNCPKTRQGSCNRMHMRCTYCGSKHHNVEACPETLAGSAQRTFSPDNVKDNFVKDKGPFEY